MPISTVIHLIPPEDVKLRPTMGHHAHAAFLSLLRMSNPKKAEEIHAASRQKPFTVSPLIGDGERRRNFLHIRAGTECWLRFTFLDDALFVHFWQCVLDTGLPVHPSWRGNFSTEPLGCIRDGSERLEWREDLRGPDRICGDRHADAGPILLTDRLSGVIAARTKNAQ